MSTTQAEVDRLIEQFDPESSFRRLAGVSAGIVTVIAVALSGWHFYTAGFGLLQEVTRGHSAFYRSDRPLSSEVEALEDDLAAQAVALLPEQHRPRRVELDPERDRRQQRGRRPPRRHAQRQAGRKLQEVSSATHARYPRRGCSAGAS